MVEAYLFFYDQIAEFFLGTFSLEKLILGKEREAPIAADIPLADRLDECYQALKNALQVVAIDLDQDDDAQVIFETLNARGEPLLPADLLRNYIFLRAARQGEPQEDLYARYWKHFDDDFWRHEVKQGRLLRPRSDLFMQHFLASRQAVDIPIKHLFVEYKFWIQKHRPYATVEEELAALARQGADFRRIIEPKRGDVLYPLVTFLDAFDIRTSYPLLLAMLDAEISDQQWKVVNKALESYLLRRAVCGMTTKNYNRVFLTLTRVLRRDGINEHDLIKQLLDMSGESTEWPTDEAFGEAWRTNNMYQVLNNPKIVHILKRLNDSYLGSKMEGISVDSPMTVEHILPQHWVEHWPLPNGSKGMAGAELANADPADPRAIATRNRNDVLHRIGNLTILSQSLNSATSNSPWREKKPELLSHSLLPINQQLMSKDGWGEEEITARAEELLKRALAIWPRGGLS